MNFTHLLELFLEHNIAVISWLTITIVLGALWIAWRSQFRSQKRSVSSIDTDLSEIEVLLKKMIESGGVKTSFNLDSDDSVKGNLADGSEPQESGSTGAEMASMGELRAKIEEQKKKIETLILSSGGGAEDGIGALRARIKELEGKLLEYEIIEEDIADLSMYREENERLKDEIGKLKTGVAATTFSQDKEEVAEEVVVDQEKGAEEISSADVVGDELMEEFAEVVESADERSSEKEISDGDTDLMSELAESMESAGEEEDKKTSKAEEEDIENINEEALPEVTATLENPSDDIVADVSLNSEEIEIKKAGKLEDAAAKLSDEEDEIKKVEGE